MVETFYGTALPGPVAPVQPPDQLKRTATARARAALRGVIVHHMLDDTGRPEFVATHGAWTRSFGAIDDLERWLDRLEGRPS